MDFFCSRKASYSLLSYFEIPERWLDQPGSEVVERQLEPVEDGRGVLQHLDLLLGLNKLTPKSKVFIPNLYFLSKNPSVTYLHVHVAPESEAPVQIGIAVLVVTLVAHFKHTTYD